MSDAHAATQGAVFGAAEPPPPKDVVLLLEDDESIATNQVGVLRRLGLRVIWTQLGAEGLAAFQRHDREVALVLADCRLPDMDGREVCQQLRAIAPTLPVLVTSGNFMSHDPGSLAPHQLVQYLPKPYAPSEIMARVRHLLAQAERAEAGASQFLAWGDRLRG
jgi:DNA-binding response OmpR family regulator